jgi:hypothetical protein
MYFLVANSSTIHSNRKRIKTKADISSIRGAIQLFDYFYHNAIKFEQRYLKTVLKTLTELPKKYSK